MWLRRAAYGLLAGYQRQAAAAAAGGAAPPPAAAAALQRAFGSSSGPQLLDQLETQPFSVALKQLEAALGDPGLPPDALAANSQALLTLRSFAQNLSPPGGGYPPSFAKRVQVVFRDPYGSGQLQSMRCLLRTTGGDCRHLVQQSLGQLMARMGLNPHFYFDGDQFQPKPAARQPRMVSKPRQRAAGASAAPPSPGEVEAVRARAAAAGFPSQTISEEQFREMEAQSEAGRAQRATEQGELEEAVAELKALDPLLNLLVVVPWMVSSQVPEQLEKAKLLQSQGVDKIEAEGFDVRGALRRIWAGERNAELLMAGKDVGSAAVIKQLVFHAKAYDAKHGKQVYRPS